MCIIPPTNPSTAPTTVAHGNQPNIQSSNSPTSKGATISVPTCANAR